MNLMQKVWQASHQINILMLELRATVGCKGQRRRCDYEFKKGGEASIEDVFSLVNDDNLIFTTFI